MLVVIDAWRHTGIGHSMLGTARWLAIAQRYAVEVRFSMCVPAGVRNRVVLQAQHAHLYTNCTDTAFDLYRHIRWRHGRVGAAVDIMNRVQHVHRHPTSDALDRLLREQRNATTISALFYAHVRELRALASEDLVTKQLKRIEYAGTLPSMRCDVGLHVRTMSVDDRECNVFVTPHKCGADLRRSTHCSLASLQRRNDACRGIHPFVTSDSREMYAILHGWNSLNETSVVTWSVERQRTTHMIRQTIAAWFVLASCTSKIVAPVSSTFSSSASRRAGVPVIPCCKPRSTR